MLGGGGGRSTAREGRLYRITQFGSVEEAIQSVRDSEPEFFETKIAMSDEGPVAIWRGDAGFDDADASRPGARHRLVMRKTGWVYERSN